MSDSNALCKLFQKWLMASYIYYHLNHNVLYDTTYDKIAKILEKHWDSFEHQHKHLVDKGNLSVTSLYNLKAGDYPMIVRQAAEIWLTEVAQGRRAVS